MSEKIMTEHLSAKRTRFGVASLTALVGVCASVLMYWIMAQGPGVSPDSTIYIETARSLLAGNGFFVRGEAVTHYPPVLPLLLGVVGLFSHGDILLAGRLLAALLFGANLVLLGLTVQACTRHSLIATGCAILVFLFSATVVLIHSMVWSEAPFISFSMAGLLLLAYHVTRPSPSLLVLASLMIGLAASTRYVGVVLFPATAFAILLLDKRSLKHRAKDILILSCLACLPLVLWLIRNMLIAHSATNREFAFHPFNLNQAKSLIISTYDFFLPISIPEWTKELLVGVAFTLFVVACGFLYRKMYIKQSVTSIRISLPLILFIYSVLYVVFLFVSISFFDAHTPVNHRILLPVFLALTVAATSVAWSLSEALTLRYVWYGFVVFLLFSVSINANRAISIGMDIHNNGIGYTSRYWKESKMLAYLLRVPESMTIYSNAPDVIRLLVKKEAVMIPVKVFSGTLKRNEDYQDQMNRMIRESKDGTALIAYFSGIKWRWYLPSKEEIESMGDIPVVRRLQDGVIYGLSTAKNAKPNPH
jgi:hypothetical protein